MVKSSTTSLTPAIHAYRHVHGAADPVIGDVRIDARVPTGGIIMWSGAIANIPDHYVLCNGASGTPDLRDRFIVGAGVSYGVGATGGATTHTHPTVGRQPPGGSEQISKGQAAPHLPPYYALAYIMKT